MSKKQKIDKLCVSFIEFFNSVGLTTKYSCQGHICHNFIKFYIIFHDNVEDSSVYDILSHLDNSQYISYGRFQKWARVVNGKVLENWIYECSNSRMLFRNQLGASEDLKHFKKIFNK